MLTSIITFYIFRAVDEDRKIEYKAAVKIQSWFRGCRVRAYLRYIVLFKKSWHDWEKNTDVPQIRCLQILFLSVL
uniref:Uncharacterized protein n=1 Tax=Athene cunicularia TaxID=194338 RepID=A0A663LWT7_ATHCN